jgi:hypothetical protein
MCTVLHAIVAATLSLLSGSSGPAVHTAQCSARQSTGWGFLGLYLVGAAGAGGWGRPIAPRRGAPPGAFFMECSRLVCRHWPRPRAGASKPDRSDGPQWAPHLIDGRQSDSQARACIFHHVHLSLRHRHRRAFLPRRFVSARSAPVPLPAMHGGQWGRGIVDGDGRSHDALMFMSLAVQASLQLSGWSLR